MPAQETAPSRNDGPRVNHQINVPQVRLVREDGTMGGVVSTREAINMAADAGLDLVEVSPNATPPVCKILDFGKYKYDEKKKAREAKRKQSVVEIKEIKLRPKTDDHDLEFKTRAAHRFLGAGHKVKFTVRFRGSAAAFVRNMDILKTDVFKKVFAYSIQYDALSGFAGTKLLWPRQIFVLLTFGYHNRANTVELDVADNSPRRRLSAGVWTAAS